MADPLQAGCFPLVPYANRIAHGCFDFAGVSYRLPLNFGDHPHSIHGLGWQSAWVVERQEESAVSLLHAHDGTRWPWCYEARQDFALTPSELRMNLHLINRDDRPMPAGLGFHPYFAVEAGSELRFETGGLWTCTTDLLPNEEVAADYLGDWSGYQPVMGDDLIDNCYTRWNGVAEIRHADGLCVTLRSDTAPYLHFYRPPGESFCCLEPVTHMPDAVNRGEGMTILAPGESLSVSMLISVSG